MTVHVAPRAPFTPRQIGWSAAAGLLLAPAIAMLFTDEVRWGAEDFAALAALIAAAGLTAEIGVRLVAGRRQRLALAGAIVAGFLIAWAELAVGILPG